MYKPLCSTVLMGVSMVLLGFAMYCKHISWELVGVEALPLLSLLIYMFTFSAGTHAHIAATIEQKEYRDFSKVVLLHLLPSLLIIPCIDHKPERSPAKNTRHFDIADWSKTSIARSYHWSTVTHLAVILLAKLIV